MYRRFVLVAAAALVGLSAATAFGQCGCAPVTTYYTPPAPYVTYYAAPAPYVTYYAPVRPYVTYYVPRVRPYVTYYRAPVWGVYW
jgi:hypothetical protein